MATIALPASLNIGPFDFEVGCEAHYNQVDEQGNIEVTEVRINGEPVLLYEDQYDNLVEEIKLLVTT